MQDRDLGDEYGWKQVHGDVFRPSSHPLIFSSLIGSGCQIFAVSFIVIIVAMLEDLYTEWVLSCILKGFCCDSTSPLTCRPVLSFQKWLILRQWGNLLYPQRPWNHQCMWDGRSGRKEFILPLAAGRAKRLCAFNLRTGSSLCLLVLAGASLSPPKQPQP